MTLWRKARTEAAGAWRSMRYDLGRPEPDAGEPGPGTGAGPGAGYPDVTSTGLSTFGGAGLTGGLRTSYGERLVPRPRRLAAVSAFGVLAVAGAAGSYLAVVNGVGALVGDKPVGVEPYPLAAEAPRGTEGDLSNSGLGRGTANAAGPPAAAPTTAAELASGAVRVLPATTAAPAAPQVVAPRSPRSPVAGKPVAGDPEIRPTACCPNPPVPTPTVPVPTPHSPSATPSPDSSAPDGDGSAEPSESPTSVAPDGPDDSGDPDEGEPRRRHARWH